MPESRKNWVTALTNIFMTRQRIALVLFLFLILGGTTALLSLRREGFPKVPVKIVAVTTVYRGAAAGEIEQSVTNPIEGALKDVSEVKSIASTSSDNFSTVIATLNENANVDAGLQNISTKVSSLNLPADAEKPSIKQPTTGGSSFVYGLTGNLSYPELLEQGRIFKREIEQVKGIKQVTAANDKIVEQITVTFDPAKLAASGVDASKIKSSLESSNLNLPAGQNLTIDGSRATLLVVGRDTSIEALGQTPLATLSGVGSVPLSSIATLERSVKFDGAIARVGVSEDSLPVAKPGLVYNADIRADADILTVNKQLEEALDRLRSEKLLSDKIQVTTLFSDAESTTRQIKEIEAGAIGEKWPGIGALGYIGYLVGGIWLLMLAMFMFVNLRTALIAGVAIPLSFLFTLLALYFGGITLNTLTLFSMILVLGLVVDPAIVVLESIQRYKDLGYSGKEGVLAGVSSIGQGLVMATLCSIIVFTPFGIVSGVFGEIIKFIPITVIPALIASFFVPLTFLAPLAAKFIKAAPHKATDHGDEAALWAASRWFKRANLYILNRTWLQVIIMLVALVAPIGVTGYLFASGDVKSAQFSTPKDTTEALVTISHPANYTDPQVDELAKAAEKTLGNHYEISSYYYFTQTPTSFTMYVNLIPRTERSKDAQTLMAELKTELPQDASKQVFASANRLSAGPPTVEFPIQIQIYDADLAKLKAFALKLADKAKQTEGVIRVSDGYTDGSSNSVQVNINKPAAAARGLNPATIGGQVAGLLGEQNLTKLTVGDQQIDVVGTYANRGTFTTEQALQNLTIGSPTGPVRLGQIATFSLANDSSSISHQNGQRFATVKAQVDDSTNPFVVQNDLNDWAKGQLAGAGLSKDALESKGEGDDIAKSFTNLFAALGIAILMIYLALALFFGSFLKPIIITFALPLSFLGVFPVLAILGTEFGFLEILGLITLAGIVVNVGIFVIDYANHRVEEGMDVKLAIAEATAVRFRPIFLTKITALGSLLPLAILSPFWRGLASVIIAGILTSGVLSLFTTPILYTWFEKLSGLPQWTARKFGRAKTS